MKFVLRTDHQPLVYLQIMKDVESRIAGTLDDLRDFYYNIEYIPSERNELTDLISRMAVPECLDIPEVTDVEYLRKVL